MKKILGILVFVMFCLSQTVVQAAESIDKVIKSSPINKGAVFVSVKDLNSGKNIYSHNSNSPVNPASTQKLITLAASLDTLGEDYKFTTELYKSSANELYLKLSADPFLSSKDLGKLLETAKSKNIIEPKNVYIDDYILDDMQWGEGWQWDDDLNPLMPKFGSYNMDDNLVKVVIKPTTPKAPADIFTEKFYPVGFVNRVVTGGYDNVSISHNQSISENLVEINGVVKEQITRSIPASNIKRYFKLRLDEAFTNNKIIFYGKIYQKKLPTTNVYLVDKVEHNISDAVSAILQDSNNMMAETVFKLAGGKFVNNTGSVDSAILMLNDYCQKHNLNTANIRIVDGSGVSKNNLMTADFMTDFLIELSKQKNFESLKENMATPGKGTLSNRMLYFHDNLRAKTGTLSNVSSIAGYIKTQKGRNLAFDIVINDPKSQSNNKKQLEEMILRAIYMNY